VVSRLAFSPNGRFVLAAARDGELRLWDLVDVMTPREVDRHRLADAAVGLVRASLGDATSSLGDAKSSLGDAES
jgi:WD40 repeat protein